MARVSQKAIYDYIANFDIEGYLYNHGIDFEDVGKDYSLKECPDCGKSDKKCFVHKEKKFYHCYSCDSKGGLFTLLSAVESLPKKAVFIREIQKIDVDKCHEKNIDIEDLFKFDLLSYEEPPKEVELFEVQFPLNFVDLNLGDGSEQSQYAIRRGLDVNTIREFGVKYSLSEKRLVFPFYHKGRLVGWQGRDITDTNEIKALTKPDGFLKEYFLYNWDRIPDDAKYITIVEGPIDLIKARFFNPVALLGSSLGKYHISMILGKRNLSVVFLALDPEEDEKRQKIFDKLSPFFKVYDVRDLPFSRDDIGECTVEEVAESLAKSQLYDDVYLDVL